MRVGVGVALSVVASVALILMRCFCIIGVAALSLVLASSVAGSPAGAVGNFSLLALNVASNALRSAAAHASFQNASTPQCPEGHIWRGLGSQLIVG